MSGLIYTKNCVVCGSNKVVVAGGHVKRKETYTGDSVNNPSGYVELSVIASCCFEHQKGNFSDDKGCFGDYEDWMGMCDDSFNQDENKDKDDYKDKFFDLQGELASVCDLLNSWAREQNVEECKDPYKAYELRNLIDRLWGKTSQKYFALKDNSVYL